eukprot:932378-Prymnesium_polylepis.1
MRGSKTTLYRVYCGVGGGAEAGAGAGAGADAGARADPGLTSPLLSKYATASSVVQEYMSGSRSSTSSAKVSARMSKISASVSGISETTIGDDDRRRRRRRRRPEQRGVTEPQLRHVCGFARLGAHVLR